MYRQIFLALIIILLIFGGASGQTKKTAKQTKKTKPAKIITYVEDQEEYAVYKAVLKENFKEQEGQVIVVNKEVAGCGSIIDDETRREFPGAVLEELFRDCYAKKWGNFELVGDFFQSEGKIVLVSEKELESIFLSSCNLGWKKFYKKFPNSSGNASFSRVGFDAQRNYAVVNFGNQSACLGGTGRIVFLQKEGDGAWKVKKSQKTWGLLENDRKNQNRRV